MRELFKIIALLLVVVFLPLQAHASKHGKVYQELADETGIIIQPLMHGQMQLMYEHHGDILALAKTHADDPIMSKLLAFEFKNRAWALFGLLPASVSDANQFLHLPTHGYLAPTRAMLERMKQIAPAFGSPEQVLYDRIEQDAIFDHNTSVMTCEYSGIVFNTNTPVGPDWSKLNTTTFLIPLASLLAVMIILAFGGHQVVLARRPKYKPTF
ncbi:MAG: hypothetical protein DI628_05990 [Blastochloris viridis]|uniref:Uncharacterized protein n=1 Tax=Blastochloris viridis TaxID=1079 RepID=A0A6N4R7Z0_BLAVI|nr:MAG: hypothetical protein DI628_05990 [Blastochloris viridis]